MKNNEVMIQGNVSRVESVTTTKGTPMAKASIAVDRFANNEKSTDFVNVTAFGRQAQILLSCGKTDHQKAKAVVIYGNLRVETWEKDEQKHSRMVVYVDEVIVIDAGSTFVKLDESAPRSAPSRQTSKPATKAKEAEPADDDSDIPF
jgi:single-stranded DNA-binding protein